MKEFRIGSVGNGNTLIRKKLKEITAKIVRKDFIQMEWIA
jgi:hypothetical protein